MLRKKDRHTIYSGLIGAGIVGLLLGGYVIYHVVTVRNVRLKYENEYTCKITKQKQKLMDIWGLKSKAWVTVRDIEPGQCIEDRDVECMHVPDQQCPSNIWSHAMIIAGKYAKIQLKKGTVVTKPMLYEEGPVPDDLRNKQLQAICLPLDICKDSIVDVRIQFSSGEDYVVLSQKKIDRLEGTTVFMKLCEKEMLTISSAIVDAYVHKASLYCVTYVDPFFQKKSIPTYPVKHNVQKLMKSDPNVLHLAEKTRFSFPRGLLEKSFYTSSSCTMPKPYIQMSPKEQTMINVEEQQKKLLNETKQME